MKMLSPLFVFLILNQFCYSQSVSSSSNCFSVSESIQKSSKDSLLIVSSCDVLDYKFEIYNRWGQVYHTSYTPGKIEIFNNNKVAEVPVAKKKKKSSVSQVENNFVEGQYIWIITYYAATDVNRTNQKTENGNLYVFE
jgi:hydrogenase maturation factor